jgi:hypothetical protein
MTYELTDGILEKITVDQFLDLCNEAKKSGFLTGNEVILTKDFINGEFKMLNASHITYTKDGTMSIRSSK